MVRAQRRQKKWRIDPRDDEQVECGGEMIKEKSHRLVNLRRCDDVIVIENQYTSG